MKEERTAAENDLKSRKSLWDKKGTGYNSANLSAICKRNHLKILANDSSCSDLIGASTGFKTGFPGQAVE